VHPLLTNATAVLVISCQLRGRLVHCALKLFTELQHPVLVSGFVNSHLRHSSGRPFVPTAVNVLVHLCLCSGIDLRWVNRPVRSENAGFDTSALLSSGGAFSHAGGNGSSELLAQSVPRLSHDAAALFFMRCSLSIRSGYLANHVLQDSVHSGSLGKHKFANAA
jgi:hypothetical protein